MAGDNINAQSTYYFAVLDENDDEIIQSDFDETSPFLFFRMAPTQISIERSIRAEVLRDVGLGYSITTGGEGIGSIRIQGTHGVGNPADLGLGLESEGLQKRNEFKTFFSAFVRVNEERGRLGKFPLQLAFNVVGGKWSNLKSESYFVWPTSFPQDSRSAARPHSWEWSLTLDILGERQPIAVVDDSSDAVIDPQEAVNKIDKKQKELNVFQVAYKKFKNISQKLFQLKNNLFLISSRLKGFIVSGKDLVYSVSDLVRGSALIIQDLLLHLDPNAILNDVTLAFRGTLFEVRRLLGQIMITGRQFERIGLIPRSLTPPQTVSRIRPVSISVGAGDSLPAIAQRLLGDSARWPDLVAINQLDYPYLDFSNNGRPDPLYAGKNVLGNGDSLKLPLPSTPGNVGLSPDPFGRDLQDSQPPYAGHPAREALLGGIENLRAAIIRRLLTPRGRIPWHPSYGSGLRRMLGAPQGLAHVEAVQAETERCLISDNRILAIQSVTTRVVDSAVVVEAEVLTPLGPLSFNLPISA